MMTQHAPGPWQTDAQHPGQIFGNDWSPVAYAGCGGIPGLRDADASEVEATARLIAAAPEMLALLKEASEHLVRRHRFASTERWDSEDARGLNSAIEFAIAKAEGR